MSEPNLITEFFYDGISRIIPGLIVIAFYGRDIVLLGNFKDASVALTICIFLAAWLIGVIIEVLTYRLGILFLSPFLYLVRRFSKLSDLDKWLHPECDVSKLNPGTTVRCIQKVFAEATMFRCLFCISIVNWFTKPEAFWNTKWSQFDSFYCTIVLLAAYCFEKHNLHSSLKQGPAVK